MNPERRLLVVAGPTASGKNSLAMHLALRLNGEIVGCDSVQVYRYFDIGTAKATAAEKEVVPHHLLDVAAPDEEYTAGEYARQGRRVLGEIASRGQLPIVTGGTGFYLRALLHGLFESPSRDENLRVRLRAREKRRPGSLHRILSRLDPESAARIHARDIQKLIRALEVTVTGNAPMSRQFRQGRDRLTGFRWLILGLNPEREALYRRLEQRAVRMFEEGLIEETRRILERGYSPSCKPFESIGYAQALAHIRGQMSLEEAITQTQMHTRRYAKRQWTWFRREPGIQWLSGFGDDPVIQEEARRQAETFLREN
jgi:tRNA dimethylallyltransferase